MKEVQCAADINLNSFGLGFTMDNVSEAASGDQGIMLVIQLLWLKFVIIFNFGQEIR